MREYRPPPAKLPANLLHTHHDAKERQGSAAYGTPLRGLHRKAFGHPLIPPL